MPKVGKKHFPYTKKGKAAAKAARLKAESKTEKYPQTKLSISTEKGGDIDYSDAIKKWKHITRKSKKAAKEEPEEQVTDSLIPSLLPIPTLTPEELQLILQVGTKPINEALPLAAVIGPALKGLTGMAGRALASKTGRTAAKIGAKKVAQSMAKGEEEEEEDVYENLIHALQNYAPSILERKTTRRERRLRPSKTAPYLKGLSREELIQRLKDEQGRPGRGARKRRRELERLIKRTPEEEPASTARGREPGEWGGPLPPEEAGELEGPIERGREKQRRRGLTGDREAALRRLKAGGRERYHRAKKRLGQRGGPLGRSGAAELARKQKGLEKVTGAAYGGRPTIDVGGAAESPGALGPLGLGLGAGAAAAHKVGSKATRSVKGKLLKRGIRKKGREWAKENPRQAKMAGQATDIASLFRGPVNLTPTTTALQTRPKPQQTPALSTAQQRAATQQSDIRKRPEARERVKTLKTNRERQSKATRPNV